MSVRIEYSKNCSRSSPGAHASCNISMLLFWFFLHCLTPILCLPLLESVGGLVPNLGDKFNPSGVSYSEADMYKIRRTPHKFIDVNLIPFDYQRVFAQKTFSAGNIFRKSSPIKPKEAGKVPEEEREEEETMAMLFKRHNPWRPDA